MKKSDYNQGIGFNLEATYFKIFFFFLGGVHGCHGYSPTVFFLCHNICNSL